MSPHQLNQRRKVTSQKVPNDRIPTFQCPPPPQRGGKLTPRIGTCQWSPLGFGFPPTMVPHGAWHRPSSKFKNTTNYPQSSPTPKLLWFQHYQVTFQTLCKKPNLLGFQFPLWTFTTPAGRFFDWSVFNPPPSFATFQTVTFSDKTCTDPSLFPSFCDGSLFFPSLFSPSSFFGMYFFFLCPLLVLVFILESRASSLPVYCFFPSWFLLPFWSALSFLKLCVVFFFTYYWQFFPTPFLSIGPSTNIPVPLASFVLHLSPLFFPFFCSFWESFLVSFLHFLCSFLPVFFFILLEILHSLVTCENDLASSVFMFPPSPFSFILPLPGSAGGGFPSGLIPASSY